TPRSPKPAALSCTSPILTSALYLWQSVIPALCLQHHGTVTNSFDIFCCMNASSDTSWAPVPACDACRVPIIARDTFSSPALSRNSCPVLGPYHSTCPVCVPACDTDSVPLSGCDICNSQCYQW
ncbi:mCG129738, partial [Mus musculus]